MSKISHTSALLLLYVDFLLKIGDQLECTDPALNDFWEPIGDSTHLVHCKDRPRARARARAGARGWTKRAPSATDLCRFTDILYFIRVGQRSAPTFTPALGIGSKPGLGRGLVSPIP